jgi:hypothetical protein
MRAPALIELYVRWLDRYIDALLSWVGFGWYEWRAMGLRKGEVYGVGLSGVLMRLQIGC